MPKVKRILLTGGGSGGHIVPNLALASAIKSLIPEADFLYIGSRNGLDRQIVKGAQMEFRSIFAAKLPRYFDWRLATAPLLIMAGFIQSLWILGRFWPQIIMTTGGFVSWPMVLAGWCLRRKIILLESDAAMGLSNRLAAKLATRVLTAFPNIYPGATVVGNPIRQAVTQGRSTEGWKITGLDRKKPVILIMGGSLGAEFINQLVMSTYPKLKKIAQIIHITGQGKRTGIDDPAYIQYEYVDDILPHLYAIASAIVSRAGSYALAEIAANATPALIIPLPNSAQGNQQKNAWYYGRAGGMRVMEQSSVTPEKWLKALHTLVYDPAQKTVMEQALQRLARPYAATQIAKIITQNSK